MLNVQGQAGFHVAPVFSVYHSLNRTAAINVQLILRNDASLVGGPKRRRPEIIYSLLSEEGAVFAVCTSSGLFFPTCSFILGVP